MKEKLAAIEMLNPVNYRGARDRLNLPARLNTKLAQLTSVVAAADFVPLRQAYDVLHDLTGRIEAQLQHPKAVIQQDVSAFEKLVHEPDLPAIVA